MSVRPRNRELPDLAPWEIVYSYPKVKPGQPESNAHGQNIKRIYIEEKVHTS